MTHLTAKNIVNGFSVDLSYLIEATLSQAELKSVLTAAADILSPPEGDAEVPDLNGPVPDEDLTDDDIIRYIEQTAKEVEIDADEEQELTQELKSLVDELSSDSDLQAMGIDRLLSTANRTSSDPNVLVLSIALLLGIQEADVAGMSQADMQQFIQKANRALHRQQEKNETKSYFDLDTVSSDILNESLPVVGLMRKVPGMVRMLGDIDKARKMAKGDQPSLSKKISNKYKDLPSSQIRSVKQDNVKDTDRVSFDSLYDDWQLNGSSFQSEDIILLLKQNGFDNKQIRLAFDNASVSLSSSKRDDRISRLSHLIHKHGMQGLILQYMNNNYGIKESVLIESLSDKIIKQIFLKVLDLDDKNTASMSTNKLMDKVTDWAREVKRAASPNEKVILVKEIVNVMANRKQHPDHTSMIAAIEKIIQSSKIDQKFMNRALQNLRMGSVMERSQYLTATYLLTECDVSWADLNLKPTVLEDDSIRLDYLVRGSNLLLEDVFRDVIAYRHIRDTLSK